MTFFQKNDNISVSNDTLFKKGSFMDIKKYLSENFFLFKGLKSSEIAKLLANETFVIEKFISGEILHSNKTTKKIGIILKGRAVIKSSDDGVIIKKLSSNDIFGAASLFDAPNYLTYVLSTTDGEMISLSEEFIKKCICTNTSLSLKYISFLSQKISFLNSKINAYTAKSAENKLLAYLNMLHKICTQYMINTKKMKPGDQRDSD